MPRTTICCLTYGDFLPLVSQCLSNIYAFTSPDSYKLVIGANAPSQKVSDWLSTTYKSCKNVSLELSEQNLGKYPMMRRLFEHVDTEFVAWFDDDVYPESEKWLGEAIATIEKTGAGVLGEPSASICPRSYAKWVEEARWYTGKPLITRKNRLFLRFVLGGWQLIRSDVLKKLDWPDKRLHHCGGDASFGEACRQNDIVQYGFSSGIRLDKHIPRRGITEPWPNTTAAAKKKHWIDVFGSDSAS